MPRNYAAAWELNLENGLFDSMGRVDKNREYKEFYSHTGSLADRILEVGSSIRLRPSRIPLLPFSHVSLDDIHGINIERADISRAADRDEGDEGEEKHEEEDEKEEIDLV